VAEKKPIKYKAVVRLSYEDGTFVDPGKTLSKKQAARLEDEDMWLVDQGLVEKVSVS